VPVLVPGFMKEIVAELSHVARRHAQVNQRSGVSVRVSTANFENLESNALRRALSTNEREAVARISDLPALMSSTAGKIELETWEDTDDSSVLEKLMKTATNNVFRRHFTVQEFSDLVQRFDRGGFTVEVGDRLPGRAYRQALSELKGIDRARQKLDEPDSEAMRIAVLEFVLEGLHLGKRLNKTSLDGSSVYGG
jgi:magnesium chelatase subunit I